MRAAYYGSGPLTGAGQTVGIFSFDGYLTADIQVYYSNTGMTSSVPVNNVLVERIQRQVLGRPGNTAHATTANRFSTSSTSSEWPRA